MLESLADAEIRTKCKEKIESLEHWLRRLIDDKLTASHGDYLSFVDDSGSRLIKKDIVDSLDARVAREPDRYTRRLDAMLLDDVIAIVCNPRLYPLFRSALERAFPEGCAEARTFLNRLVEPRNRLAHSNPISLRQAEQVVCYSNDVVDSLKGHYRDIGMQDDYDVPLILRVTDSFGNSFHRHQMGPAHDGGIMKVLVDQPSNHLRPGDILTIDVEVDPSFDEESYVISWGSAKGLYDQIPNGRKAVIKIGLHHVAQEFDVQCRVKSTREWHRMSMGVDDFLMLVYKVLPPP